MYCQKEDTNKMSLFCRGISEEFYKELKRDKGEVNVYSIRKHKKWYTRQ